MLKKKKKEGLVEQRIGTRKISRRVLNQIKGHFSITVLARLFLQYGAQI